MKIKITRGVIVFGKPRKPGDVVEIDDRNAAKVSEGRRLLYRQFAVIDDAKTPKGETKTPKGEAETPKGETKK